MASGVHSMQFAQELASQYTNLFVTPTPLRDPELAEQAPVCGMIPEVPYLMVACTLGIFTQ